MSMLNQLFNRGLLGAKCKTCLTLAISRIKLLQNKRDVNLKLMRKEIAEFLLAGQEAIARIRVEHVIREQNTWEAYEILELFCEFVLARVPVLESQRECPTELRESVASIIFAAPRCSDLPDLLNVRNLFAAKYGKEFISAASELRPDTSVNRTMIEKLSVTAPPADQKLKVLLEIAAEHNINWNSTKTEAEFRKKPEDLLNGPKPIAAQPGRHSRTEAGEHLDTKDKSAAAPFNGKQGDGYAHAQPRASPSNSASVAFRSRTIIESSTREHKVEPTPGVDNNSSSVELPDALQRACAAIAAAERACAEAWAAAELVNAGQTR
ncbi:uncharacterized protein LOC127245414 [Andrographis paniculata]|uniref:uncharacterized protein LOC127245414 n=1 Tax=Andrographis paniculata TaxID=175694 RepID=UPI0021E7EBE9|nr:uncharacterized protein LOC127245414 [Andrographis paniculata]